MSNIVDPIPVNAEPRQQISAINGNFQRLDARTVAQQFGGNGPNSLTVGQQEDDTYGITVYRGGVPHLRIGELQDGSSGVEVAQSGVDVTTATDEQLILSSRFNMLKVVDTGVMSLTTNPGGTQVVNYPHNLGYVPVGLVYTEFTTNAHSLLPYTVYNPVGGAFLDVLSHYDFFLDDTLLSIQSRNGTGQPPATLSFRYYLFRETAT